METIKITKTVHPQNGKEVDAIEILGHTFVYSDKRGFQTEAKITREFAQQIIDAFPVKYGQDYFGKQGKPVYHPERLCNEEVTLKWNYFGKNKYELAIHNIGHVWASAELEAI